MIIALLLSIFAGSLLGIQNIFNSKVNQKAGTWVTTTLVLAMGFLASFLIGFVVEGQGLFSFHHMKLWYFFSGIIGVGVVASLVNSMKLLNPTYAIAIALTSQLGFALLFDSLGWFGLTKVPFTFKQLLAVIIIVVGILVFKLGGRNGEKKSEELHDLVV